MALKPARLQWSGDGGLESLDFGDVYFRRVYGVAESDYVFLQCNRLEERFRTAESFAIGELGFGSGLNFLLTAALWRRTAPKGAFLDYVSIEKHPIEKTDLARAYAAWPELKAFSDAVLAQYPPMIEGFHSIHLPGIRLTLAFGDVADVLPQVRGMFDAWYLDGFAPAKNPAMWDSALFPLLRARMKPGGTLATFSAVGDMRRALTAAGFEVKRTRGFRHKWHMTTARVPGEPVPPIKKPVTVIGAGLAGCSAAYALARRGYQVTVIDRHGAPAQEASGNPLGILYPKLTVDNSPMGQYHSHGFCYTRALLETLNVPSWNSCGVVMLDLDAEEKARTKALVEKNEYPADFAAAVENPDTGISIAQSALHHAGGGCLSPPELCAALLDHPNIRTIYGQEARVQQGGITVIAASNGLAAFPEAAGLPLEPLRGQISYVTATAESKKLKTVLCHEGFFTPAVNGVHIAGATFQKEAVGGADVRDADHVENLAKLHAHIPALKDANKVTGGRAGWRSATPDKLPLAGPCPDIAAFEGGGEKYVPDIYVTAGFGAHGLSGAPLAGEMIAAMIAEGPLPVPAALVPYLAPARFLLRARRKKSS